MKENKVRIKIPVYDSEINLIITDDVFKSCKKIFKREGWDDLLESEGEEETGSAYFLYDDGDVGYYYIILPRNADIFLISHEVLHATFIILDHHGVIFDKQNHEAFTYLHGHLVETVYNKIKKLK
jgi:hypothetical protein